MYLKHKFKFSRVTARSLTEKSEIFKKKLLLQEVVNKDIQSTALTLDDYNLSSTFSRYYAIIGFLTEKNIDLWSEVIQGATSPSP